MSKGNPSIVVRMTEEEIRVIDSWIDKTNHQRNGEPYTRASFVRSCILERFQKLDRAKASAQRRKVKGGGGGVHQSIETAVRPTHEVISHVEK